MKHILMLFTFFKYLVDLQGNSDTIKFCSEKFVLKFILSTIVPNISYFTFYMLHIAYTVPT